jgi:glycyl-tRNA synthetase beta chain
MSARSVLLELGCEELPPQGLAALAGALADGLAKGLDAASIPHGSPQVFATPRRLAVLVPQTAERGPDRSLERRGPPIASAFDAAGEPTQAARAFAKSCGVEVAALARLTTDKGTWLAFRGTETGAATTAVLPGIVVQAIAGLPISKRMRWGSHTAEFVRPVHWVVLLFGEELIPAEILGLESGRVTRGHRFHAPAPIALLDADRYADALRDARVIADGAARRAAIHAGVTALAAELGGRALIEPALLDEVTALVEWPVPIAGRFEARFLALPREVVAATIQGHQRYFPVEAADGTLQDRFITVSNIESRDPGQVRAGNERVVRPRLTDAAFFWEQDRKQSLEAHAAKLAGVTFQAKLGSYADKTSRVRALALEIGARIGAGPLVDRAAALAKADLMTAMVGEFPELQGTMGRYYALAQGEPAELARALEEQYLPRFAGDALPASKTGQALSVADKLDTLVGIFAIDQKPTGAKDPFGLRRAALGILRILLEGGLDVDLPALIEHSAALQPVRRTAAALEAQTFIRERLRGLLLERGDGTTPEMIEAVFAAAPRSPLDVEARLRALREFLALPEAGVLAAANKRIANILKKTPLSAGAAVDVSRFTEAAERELERALSALAAPVAAAMAAGEYALSLRLSSGLRTPIDAFFAGVMVMDEDAARRENRLALLRDVRTLFGGVADLSRLPG